MELSCEVCDKEYDGQEPRMCCSGYECGCMGRPIDPMVCSIECYYHLPMYLHLTEEERQALILKENP